MHCLEIALAPRAALTLQFARHKIVDIAPHPSFAWFDGANQRVLRPVKVLRCVLVLRRIAATYMTTRQTEPEMHPGIAHCKTFLAAFLARVLDLNLIEVTACFWHVQSSNLARSHFARRAPAS